MCACVYYIFNTLHSPLHQLSTTTFLFMFQITIHKSTFVNGLTTFFVMFQIITIHKSTCVNGGVRVRVRVKC